MVSISSITLSRDKYFYCGVKAKQLGIWLSLSFVSNITQI